jgi:hypothetical protein
MNEFTTQGIPENRAAQYRAVFDAAASNAGLSDCIFNMTAVQTCSFEVTLNTPAGEVFSEEILYTLLTEHDLVVFVMHCGFELTQGHTLRLAAPVTKPVETGEQCHADAVYEVQGLPVGYEGLVQIRSGSRWEYMISTNLPLNFQKSVDSYASAEMAANALNRDLPNLIA